MVKIISKPLNLIRSKATQPDTKFQGVLLIAFIILGVIGIIHHEMWRDELEAWLIAGNSNSISNLFNNIEYTGHPGLWYLFLYAIARFTPYLWVMQLFHLSIAAVFIYLFLWYSPFNRVQKALFCFGYFPFYEYSLITRSYGINLVFLFAFCIFFTSRHRSYIPLAIVLSLLAYSNAYGVVISFALVLTLILDVVVNSTKKIIYPNKWNISLSFIIYAITLVVAIAQILPPADAEYRGDLLSITESNYNSVQLEYLTSIRFYGRRIITAVASVWRGYVPIPEFSEFHFHNTNILYLFTPGSSTISVDAVGFTNFLEFFLSLSILAIGAAIFYRQPIILFLYTVANIGLIGFIYLCRVAFIRHSGFLFIVFLVCAWLSNYYPQSNWLSNFNSKFFIWFSRKKVAGVTILLFIHTIGGVYAYSRDILDPFSASQAAVDYIKQNQYDELLIVGSNDALVAPISALLDRQIYYPESKSLGSFTVWAKGKPRRDSHQTHQDILKQTSDLIEEGNQEILLVLTEELAVQSPQTKIKTLAKFEDSIVDNEVYYLYFVTAQ